MLKDNFGFVGYQVSESGNSVGKLVNSSGPIIFLNCKMGRERWRVVWEEVEVGVWEERGGEGLNWFAAQPNSAPPCPSAVVGGGCCSCT